MGIKITPIASDVPRIAADNICFHLFLNIRKFLQEEELQTQKACRPPVSQFIKYNESFSVLPAPNNDKEASYNESSALT